MQRGANIGGYRLDQPLGHGGYGVVWAAVGDAGERVAIKVLSELDDRTRRRFATEARAMSRVDHPRAVRVIEVGTTAERIPYIVMELIEGPPLSSLRGQQVAIDRVIEIGSQIAEVLAAAHAAGIIHRDLKPDNVILSASGVKVLDFGLAKLVGARGPSVTKTGQFVGTPLYMSPEQLRGSRDVTTATDQYALGVVLYELLEGRRPFDGKDLVEIGTKHVQQSIPPITRADCTPHLRQAICRMMAKTPEQRFPSVVVAAKALRGEVSVVPQRQHADATKSRAFVAGLIAIATLTVGVLALRFTRSEAPPRHVARTAAVASVERSRPAAVPTEDIAEVLPTDGCGRSATPGWSQNSHFDGLTRRSGYQYIPTSYAPDQRHPLLFLMTGQYEDARAFARTSGFASVADREGFVVVAPLELIERYYDPSIELAIEDMLSHVSSQLCIDPRRIYVVGHSHGASAAERISCAPWIAALGISSWATTRYKPLYRCAEQRRVPTIALWPLQSRSHPAEGGRADGCRAVEIPNLDGLEQLWRKRNGCSAAEPSATLDGRCRAYSCEVAYSSCHLDGGHGWPGTPPRSQRPRDPLAPRPYSECDGTPAEFPSAEVTWKFLSTVVNEESDD